MTIHLGAAAVKLKHKTLYCFLPVFGLMCYFALLFFVMPIYRTVTFFLLLVLCFLSGFGLIPSYFAQLIFMPIYRITTLFFLQAILCFFSVFGLIRIDIISRSCFSLCQYTESLLFVLLLQLNTRNCLQVSIISEEKT